MSKLLSLKLQDEIFKDTENIVKIIHMPRNFYINKAVNFFNKMYQRKLLKKKLSKESKMVLNESLYILNEFEQFEEDYG